MGIPWSFIFYFCQVFPLFYLSVDGGLFFFNDLLQETCGDTELTSMKVLLNIIFTKKNTQNCMKNIFSIQFLKGN